MLLTVIAYQIQHVYEPVGVHVACAVCGHVQVLNSLLRRKRLLATDKKHLSLLDPFVQHLVDSIESQHIQVSDRRHLNSVSLDFYVILASQHNNTNDYV